MDAIVLRRRSKTLRLFPDQDRDIISSLQDEILHHILSFVPAKDVVWTSILSKRWLNLRTTSPMIILVDIPSSTYRIGLQVVNRVLNQHDSSDIKKLSLFLSSPVNLSHIESWLQTAKTHNVQRLNLVLNLDDDQLKFPISIYNCQSLEKMKLRIKTILKAPKSTQLSSLRFLHLNKVIFYSHGSVIRLLNNCPVLEQLELMNCEWQNVRSVSVIMPMLRTLIIEQNLAHGNILCCYIMFTAPKLTTFECRSDLKVAFCLDDQSSLKSAYIDLMFQFEDVVESACRITRLLLDIQNVKCLSISDDTLWSIFHWGVEIPTFYSLTHLHLDTTFTLYMINECLRFLDKSPKLEYLDLAEGMVWQNSPYVYVIEDIIPSCFNFCLKKVCIENYEARADEWWLLKFILTNATALERLLIYFSDNLLRDPERQRIVIHQIENHPRGSERLLIYYSDKMLMDRSAYWRM